MPSPSFPRSCWLSEPPLAGGGGAAGRGGGGGAAAVRPGEVTAGSESQPYLKEERFSHAFLYRFGGSDKFCQVVSVVADATTLRGAARHGGMNSDPL